ncbi:hypothetical protein QVD17_18984 [Tagetes erecta]|uniref:F-box domain-containing protein n=1 Tax=Tagetes erecta TaxID=13708 RepID=A0AAD8NWI1_TARER|nr:hypothetical protein QVD17_18984 [Tagetes erecta]
MSDNIPFEIQTEIIQRLPVKSLIRFRSVSKTWKSLIDSSDFVARYSGQQRLLVGYDGLLDFKQKYVSVVDDDTFPQHKVYVHVPLMVKMLKRSTTIDGSHGLLCSHGDYQLDRDSPTFGTGRAVMWNPSIRKAVSVVVPNVAYGTFETVLGFGVCRETNDPKIVKIIHISNGRDVGSITCIIPRQVEVFTLSTNAWRYSYSNLPRKSIHFSYYRVVIDGFIYWLATDRIARDGGVGKF